MEFTEAGKFLKKKRKSAGYGTQKSFIQALVNADSSINCSESYISLIESGAKSPSVHLLDVMSNILNMTPQEKGELLLIYKRVPSDLEFAVRNNLKETLKITNLDSVKKRYENDKSKDNFNVLVRALVLEGKSDEAIDLLRNAPDFSSSFIDLQDRTAKMAAITGNYDFAIQAFNLALENCSDEFISTRADIYMNIGICYFNKGLQFQNDKPLQALELLLQSRHYLEKSLAVLPENIYCLDEYARCTYHLADLLQFLYNRGESAEIQGKALPELAKWLDSEIKNAKIDFKKPFIKTNIESNFKTAQEAYRQILSHSEKGDLPEKALKLAVYFYAYIYCKLGKFEEALLWINSIIILEQNWLVYFLKAGYGLMKFEKDNNPELLDEVMENLVFAMEIEPEEVKSVIRSEKDRELKTLWQHRSKELQKLLQEDKVNA